ncbi:MAG TPA: phosphatase PAP2 family protein [Dehalococcoidia bacterium]|nr:phosphatase PAP2 family protein [Dehalococcoidia bacterium]
MEQTRIQSGFSLRRARFLQEILIVGLGYLVYSQVRGMAGDRVSDAFANGHRIVELERDLGIFKELALQSYLLPHAAAVHLFNYVYFYGLFPLLLPTAVFLFLKRPHVYTLARNAFLASGAIAVVFFLLLPTAPPRLLDIGFIDTLNRSLAPSYSSIPGVNHYAALPSMHVGWNFLTCLSLYLAFDGVRGRGLLLAIPVVMLTSTVVTGNHYFLDGLLGVIVAGAGLGAALWLKRWQERRTMARLQAPSDL